MSNHGFDEAQRQYDNQTPPWYDTVGYECVVCGEWTDDEDHDPDRPCPWCWEDEDRVEVCEKCNAWVEKGEGELECGCEPEEKASESDSREASREA